MLKWDVRELDLPGVKLIQPRKFTDERGWLTETYSREFFVEHVTSVEFARDVASFSYAGVLRGLHYELPGNEKLVRLATGSVCDVVVDLRHVSPTFGKWTMIELTAEEGSILYIPSGLAHGYFCRQDSLMLYKLSGAYQPNSARTLLWNDADLAIPWPDPIPTLSEADQRGIRLADYRLRPDY